MTKPESDFFTYRAVLSKNRELFLLNHEDVVSVFVDCDRHFELMKELLCEQDRNGETQVTLAAFSMLMQRQSRIAFNLVSEYQVYQGWVMFRFVVEIALFIGMFIDDRNNFEIWRNKNRNPKEYMKTFQGKNFCPKCLHNSEKIRRTLKRMNDDHLHVNPDYFYRSVGLSSGSYVPMINLKVAYTDNQRDAHVNAVAMLHILALIQESLWKTFLDKLYPNQPLKALGLMKVRETFLARVERFVCEKQEYGEILNELGAWGVPDG